MKIFKYLLIFVPVSWGTYFLRGNSLGTFITSALAIVPLAFIISRKTDRLRSYLGSSWGGLINVTFGNATELIISLYAIIDRLLNVVKANITGSIVMNLLLVLGLSFFTGGLKHRKQTFDKVLAIANGTMLMLAVIGMLIPAIFYFASPNIKTLVLGKLSLGVGAVLFVTYMASLYYTLVIHENEKKESHRQIKKSPGRGSVMREAFILFLVTSLVAVEANILVGSITIIQKKFNISPVFIGVIILPIISNVAENLTAITMARENKIDLSINIAIGSSIQVALFLVPLLIFISHLINHPMNVLFNLLEVSSIGLSVLAINIVYLQGESNWFEGLQLCAAYLIIAIAFYFA
ncbi:calcium/proton exchanger [Halothermothrix orenii]|uniref:Ca(2+)/H(+) antiporter n=1 Tax=Halothermothrix orenii (strain H 168 / OCM 544 / DSM 9562) TaxID=373903 RepID=B8D0E8_HALOH|nr:calcium/proton exchanger [Halothermothrix orenii]ACL70884.1 calcium/proton antiporter, CaCA family [Halothermothrix orenii H 168]